MARIKFVLNERRLALLEAQKDVGIETPITKEQESYDETDLLEEESDVEYRLASSPPKA